MKLLLPQFRRAHKFRFCTGFDPSFRFLCVIFGPTFVEVFVCVV